MARDKIERPSIFDDLVAAEALNTAELEEALGSADLQVVNTTMALQQAVLSGVEAYPDWSDGHPTAAGHRIIAQKVAEALPASATSPK
jgi:lysophospholipase L1-like esterase